MSSEILVDADHKMARAVEAMERDFQGIRTGRASTSLVERIHVEYYGTSTPLNQLAGISVPEPHQIVIQPWDRGVLGAIEKAITKSDIGLMPNVDGTVVRLNIPPLTEERRKDLVKVVHKRMEEARVEIRNLRRDAADHLKKEERDGAGRCRRGASPARDPPEDDRPAHRRRRPPRSGSRNRRSSRSSGPRTVARPTDAPPTAHEAGEIPLVPEDELPRHVAIIMDGNRRWARSRDLPELEGHAAGVEAIRGLLRHAVRRGVPILTLYAFSRENWARSDEEVIGLFDLLEAAIRSETDELRAQGVRVRLLGRLDELPDATRDVDRGAHSSATDGGDAAAPQHRLQLRRSDRAGRRGPAARRPAAIAADAIDEARDQRGALHGRPAGSRPGHPDRRRAAPLELPDLAVGLRRVLHVRDPVARLRTGGIRRGPPRVRPPSSPLRALTDGRGCVSERSVPPSSSRSC